MLTLCTACSRHVHYGASHCPFCRARITTQPKRARTLGRAGRAAILFGALSASACGGAQSGDTAEPPPDDEIGAPTPLYGVPAPDDGQNAPPPDGEPVAAYGAPAPPEQP